MDKFTLVRSSYNGNGSSFSADTLEELMTILEKKIEENPTFSHRIIISVSMGRISS